MFPPAPQPDSLGDSRQGARSNARSGEIPSPTNRASDYPTAIRRSRFLSVNGPHGQGSRFKPAFLPNRSGRALGSWILRGGRHRGRLALIWNRGIPVQQAAEPVTQSTGRPIEVARRSAVAFTRAGRGSHTSLPGRHGSPQLHVERLGWPTFMVTHPKLLNRQKFCLPFLAEAGESRFVISSLFPKRPVTAQVAVEGEYRYFCRRYRVSPVPFPAAPDRQGREKCPLPVSGWSVPDWISNEHSQRIKRPFTSLTRSGRC